MPVAIGLRTASSSPYDGAIIDLAAVAISSEGEIKAEYHEYVKADGFRAYKPAALVAAGVTWDYLAAAGGSEDRVVLEWRDWIEKYSPFGATWLASSEGFEASAQRAFLERRLQQIDPHRGSERLVDLIDTASALLSLGLGPKEVRRSSFGVTEWLRYTPPTAQDDAMERAIATARAATVLTEHLKDLRRAMALLEGTNPKTTEILPA
jgi:hypothetical protein